MILRLVGRVWVARLKRIYFSLVSTEREPWNDPAARAAFVPVVPVATVVVAFLVLLEVVQFVVCALATIVEALCFGPGFYSSLVVRALAEVVESLAVTSAWSFLDVFVCPKFAFCEFRPEVRVVPCVVPLLFVFVFGGTLSAYFLGPVAVAAAS